MDDTHYCVIGKLKLREIPGSRTLQLGFFDGLPYAVGKDITEDDLVAIFLPDGQLSEEFAAKNDLIERRDPTTGERAGGFFGSNRKVRSIKLMNGKVTSVGFVAPLSYFSYTGYGVERFKEGMSFNSLDNFAICGKFITEASKKAAINARDRRRERRKFVSKVIFPQHVKHTSQFMRNAESVLEDGDLVYLTWKLDGTSVRIGNVYESIRWPWWKEWLNKYLPLAKLKLTHMTGTRTVNLKSERSEVGHYGNNGIYKNFGDSLEGMLYPGEVLYGEIVGWIDNERPLFNRGGMFMTYGCPPGTRKMFIYNIRWTLPNGQMIDLPWPRIKQRCLELGLTPVTDCDLTLDYDTIQFNTSGFKYDSRMLGYLEALLINNSQGTDPLDNSHIKEGIVVRVEKPTGTVFLKYKSPDFYALEDKSKSEGIEDIEEVQSETNEQEEEN